MMLWDLIRDFIVKHITGGFDSLNNAYDCMVNASNYTTDFNFLIGDRSSDTFYSISMGDWLATTLTIISLIFILVACVMFVVKMIKLVGNLVK